MLLKPLRYLLLSCLILLTGVGGTYFVLKDNIHTVIPQQIYRSAQLSADKFTTLIQTQKIKSVLNLRGDHSQKDWYQQELALSRTLGVQHYDLALRAYKLPPWRTVEQLVDIIEAAPKPLLIHCEGGSDRTGLASAIALILANQPLDVSKQQFSVQYLVVYPHSVGKQVFARYDAWLQQQQRTHSKQNFLQWVQENAARERLASPTQSAPLFTQ